MVEEGDGSDGWPSRALYDVIVVSGGMPGCPRRSKAQKKSRRPAVCFHRRSANDGWPSGDLYRRRPYESVDVFENVVPALRNARAGRMLFASEDARCARCSRPNSDWLDDPARAPVLLDVREPWEFELSHLDGFAEDDVVRAGTYQ